MFGGNRRYVLAAIGWLILGGANAPPHNQQKTDATANSQGAFQPYPNVDESRCYQAPNHDQSDLCAQWRAALAAEKAATAASATYWLSLIAVVLTAVGTAALFVTLRLTRKTLDTQIASERPVVIISRLIVSKGTKKTEKLPVSLYVQWRAVNHGSTVGFVDAVNVTIRAGKTQPASLDDGGTVPLRVPIAPSTSVEAQKHTLYQLSPGQVDLALKTETISAAGFVRYHNVAQQRWETHFSIMIEIDQNFDSVTCYPVPGTAKVIDRRLT